MNARKLRKSYLKKTQFNYTATFGFSSNIAKVPTKSAYLPPNDDEKDFYLKLWQKQIKKRKTNEEDTFKMLFPPPK